MSRNRFLTNEPSGDAEAHDAQALTIQQIRELQEAFAARIIASGVLQGDDVVETVVQTIGHEALFADAIRALGDRLEAAGVDATMPDPNVDDVTGRGPFEDAMLSRAIEWGHAGYLLGVAIGMRLGPHAFDTGGAK